MLTNEYIKMNGRIYEVIGKDGRGLPVCQLTDLKEIPVDKPLKKTAKIKADATDKEIAESFIEDVEAVKDMLPEKSEEKPKKGGKKA